MNDNPRSNKLPRSIGVLLVGVLFLVACQTTAAQPNTSIATNAPSATAAPTKTTAPTNTALPAPTNTPAASTSQASIPATGGEATINVADNPKLGKILVDGNGMTLYMYTKDEPNKSNCTGKCLEAWPPLLTHGKPTLGEGVDDSLVGSTTLADGSMIVTYNKMPLYLWYKDTKPGDATGQGNKEVWYVVSPEGIAVGRPTPTPSSSSASSSTGDGYSYSP